MSTLRVTNIEAKGDPSSPSVDEKLKLTNSTGDIVLEVDGKNVGAGQTVFVGSGIVTATTVNANLTGNVTGNLTGNADSATTAINALGITTTQITVGDSFIKSGSVGLGTTTTAGRDVGISTAAGTIIYNSSLEKVQVYKTNRGWVDVNDAGDTLATLEATGGIINEYADGAFNYRSHTFTSSGTFEITTLDYTGLGKCDIFLIGGGGGGAFGGGGGGAAGYLRSQDSALGSVPGPNVFTVTIGGGGAGGNNAPEQEGIVGGDTVLSNPSNADILTSKGGGGGRKGGGAQPAATAAGGSGGGCGHNTPGGTPQANNGPATQPSYTSPLPAINSTITQNVGYAGGGPGPGNYTGGGGGGAAAVGGAAQPGPGYNDGGAGLSNTDQFGPGTPMMYGGGGGGGVWPSGSSTGGSGIGGGNTSSQQGTDAVQSTGSGGGGGSGNGSYYEGGQGSSGTAIIRYKIGSLGTAKASGGNISFYGGKTIHIFNSSGTFSTSSPFSETVEYVVVGGGGGGAAYIGGGGGAGGYRTGTTPVSGANSLAVTIGSGGPGGYGGINTPGTNGNPSSWNSIVGSGGGYGARAYSTTAGGAGGSGGGGSVAPGPGSGGAGNQGGFTPPEGNPGGTGSPTVNAASGGGGGAGGGGYNGNHPSGGDGGIGVQIPATFHDPAQAPSNTTNPFSWQRGGGLGTPGPAGAYYVAGGGGAGNYNGPSNPEGHAYGGAGGGGKGARSQTLPSFQTSGIMNTGSGGGGATTIEPQRGGQGGSGIVLLAYPT